jgi:hypothetical protein
MLLVAGFALAGEAKEHVWYRDAPPRPDAQRISASAIHPVAKAQVAAATAMLQVVSSREVSAAKTAVLLGTAVPIPPGTKAYLVRALVRTDGEFGITVSQAPGALYVHTSTMGPSVPPTRPHPIIVFLAAPPGSVFPSSGVVS